MKFQSKRIQVISCALAFIVLCLIYHWPIWGEGKVYANQWIFRQHAPFPAAPGEVLNPLNQNSDTVTHYFAHKYYLARALRAGQLPLWNPYVFSGFPVYGNGSASVFSPFNLLLLWVNPFRAYSIVLAFSFLISAMFFATYLRRHLRLSYPAVLVGVLALALCPMVIEFIDLDSANAFLWVFPLVVLILEISKARSYRGWIIPAALALFLTALMGHVHVLINTFFLFVSYAWWIRTPSKNVALVKWLMGVGLLFAGLSFFVLWPVLEFYTSSQWVGGGAVKVLPMVSLTPWTSLYPFLPKLPLFNVTLQQLSHGTLEFTRASNLSATVFMLSTGGLFLLLQRGLESRIRYFLIWILFFHFLTIFPLQILPAWLGSIVGLLTMKIWHLYVFASAIVAAYVVDGLTKGIYLRHLRAWFGFILIFAVLPLSVVALYFSVDPDGFRGFVTQLLERTWPSKGSTQIQTKLDTYLPVVAEWLKFSSSFILIPLLSVLTLLVITSKKLRKRFTGFNRWIKPLIVFCVVLDLFCVGKAFGIIPVDPHKVFPETAETKMLAGDRDTFRVMALQAPPSKVGETQTYVLKPNLGTPYGLYDVGGQDSILPGAYIHMAKRYLGREYDRERGNLGILDFEDVDAKIAGFLNVKYVLALSEYPLNEPGLTSVMQNRLSVYKNEHVLPRIFFTREVRPFESIEASFKSVSVSKGRRDTIVYVEDEEALSSTRDTRQPAPVDFSLAVNGDALVNIETKDAGVMVYTDNFAPGWKVLDNGQPGKLLRVNGLFKGIALQPGQHEVRFVYQPRMVYGGMLLSLGLACGILFIGLGRFLHSRKSV